MKTELEKCLAGEVFNGGDKELATMALNAKRLLKELNNTDYADVELKRNILQKLFGKIGENVCMWILISIANTGNIFLLAIR